MKLSSKFTRFMCVIALCFALCSCDEQINERTIVDRNGKVTEVATSTSTGRMCRTHAPSFTIKKLHYEGHDYLYFMTGDGYQGWGGFTHDENCRCRK